MNLERTSGEYTKTFANGTVCFSQMNTEIHGRTWRQKLSLTNEFGRKPEALTSLLVTPHGISPGM